MTDHREQSIAGRLRDPRDRRSTGRSDDVAAAVLASPELLPELVAATSHDDRLVRMRAADALEKVTRRRPELLAPHAPAVLHLGAARGEPEVRWHVAQLLPRLPLGEEQRAAAVGLMTAYLGDSSRIVQTFALQALVELTADDPASRGTVLAKLRELAERGSPAVRSRARHLLRDRDGATR